MLLSSVQIAGLGCAVTFLAGMAPGRTESLCKGCRITPAIFMAEKSMNLRHPKGR